MNPIAARVVGEERSDLAIRSGTRAPARTSAATTPGALRRSRSAASRPVPPRPVGHPVSVPQAKSSSATIEPCGGGALGRERVRDPPCPRGSRSGATRCGTCTPRPAATPATNPPRCPIARGLERTPPLSQPFQSPITETDLRVGRRRRQRDARRALQRERMRAELLVDPQVGPSLKRVQIVVGQKSEACRRACRWLPPACRWARGRRDPSSLCRRSCTSGAGRQPRR